MGAHAEKQGDDSGQGEDEEEEIIVLEKTAGFLFVVIPVQGPEPAVHDIFMGQPGYALHAGEGAHCDPDMYDGG